MGAGDMIFDDSDEAAASPSPSRLPTESFSSDKENHDAAAKSKDQLPAELPATPDSGARDAPGASGNKRRRLEERPAEQTNAEDPGRAVLAKEQARVGNNKFYDPEQPISERRALRRGYRDLSRALAG